MKKLIALLINADIKRASQFDDTICSGTPVKVYTAETDTHICKIWNASNDNGFNRQEVCKEIGLKLLSDEDIVEGTVSYNFNEIMFEIEEK